MPTLANDLVQFLMQLFGNREAIQEFLDDPERALAEHGLGNVCSADVDAAMPVVLDYAPITVNASSLDRVHHTGGNSAWAGHTGSGYMGSGQAGTTAAHAGSAAAIHGGGPSPGQGGTDYDQDDHAHAVQQLHHVVNHFSYTTNTTMLDDRDTTTDQSVNQNIWAHGDVEQWFDHDAVVASGDYAVAAGDDASVRDSNNIRDSYNADHSTDNSRDSSIHAGGDVGIGNEVTAISGSFNTDDSFNTDVGLDVDDSFNDNSDHSDYSDHSDHSVSTDTALDVRDSFNDNSDNSTHNSVEVEDSFNPDNSTNTAVDVHVDDSFQDNSATNTVQDNLVVADNQLDFTEDNPSHTDVDLENHTAIDHAVVDDSTAL
ncbi:IniB N-terminal domain-containing protein [Arthrobacter sp. FW306-07-I]|uniref:IniB N-terminal domain-containing protein n=1 Tax=Arthrobacter sp. FW306-07-I TaxID=2879622 RepID=UPI001F41C051|nr:IniB N-terminal domain-containing protein [Arthrobacter sp. FW306-07-I]UKA74739.1 IniB N-terminal domain-containing protein [Arthrobacter sp. FW306-07-I]